MQLNLIKSQNHSCTYSSETIVATALREVHSVKDPLIWTPNDTGTTREWVKFNFYYLTEVTKIEFVWDGSCTSLEIEYSLDNYNWNTLASTWVPDDYVQSLDYSSDPTKMVYLRFIVNSPVAFVLSDFDVYSDVIWENTDIISHNYLRAYGSKFREEYPVIPSFIHDMFKMTENYNNLDKTLFDSTLYATTAVICNDLDPIGELSVTNLTLDLNTTYIWDYDEVNIVYVEGTDGVVDIVVDDTSFTTDIDMSSYTVNGLLNKYLIVVSGMNTGSYLIVSNTANTTGNTIVTSALPYTLSNMKFKIQDIEESVLLDNPNIIITDNPNIPPVDHAYTTPGIYHPRLLIIGSNYTLEFNSSITIT